MDLQLCYSPVAVVGSFVTPQFVDSTCLDLLTMPASSSSLRLSAYIILFALTCVMEAPIYFWGLRRRLGLWQILTAIVLLNLATHPAVTYLFPWALGRLAVDTRTYIFCAEAFAFIVEALILCGFFRVSLRRAFVVSTCANLFSWWGGLYVASWLGL